MLIWKRAGNTEMHVGEPDNDREERKKIIKKLTKPKMLSKLLKISCWKY